jgi:Mannosyltransferase (PIG-M)
VKRAAPVVAVAICALLGSWALVHHTTPQSKLIVDTPVYERYGDAVVHGRVPYRDFRLEYPPGALPMFILPSLGHTGDSAHFDRWFDREMAVCACLALLGVGLITRRPTALASSAAAPLLLGPVVLSRFDYWPTALAVLALAALLRNRLAVSAVVLGVAISAKIWPAIFLPFAVVWLWRGRSREAALAFLGRTLAAVAAIITPFLVLSPGGTWYSVHQQFARPLQIESLGSAVLVVLHHLFGTNLGIISSYGSQNVGGSGVAAVATATNIVLLLALAVVFVTFLRREPSRDQLLAACAAAVAALIAFGKVFSPQYMIWLVPLVPLVPSALAGILLVAGLLLTQVYFPAHYWNYGKYFYFQETLEVLVRDLVIVALFAALAHRVARRARAPRTASEDAAVRGRPAEPARRGA